MTSQIPLSLSLLTPNGEPVMIQETLQHHVTIVQLMRYFGCLPRQEWLVGLDRAARSLAAYARSLAQGFRPQAITRDTVRSPAVVILDQSGTVQWSFVGSRIGHYPPLVQVIAAATSAGSAKPAG